jgi:hypothetical protein
MPTLADFAIYHRSYAVPTNKGNQTEQLLQYSDWSKARTECLVGETDSEDDKLVSKQGKNIKKNY